jgi:hypothetical protein
MTRAINFQTVSWFWDLYQRKLLDLDPPYQRRSVWNQNYKDFFIDTVLNNYPAPAIFLYQEITPEGVSKYGVVDGKQRLSTLFEFAQNEFPVGEKPTKIGLRDKYFKDLEAITKQDFWKYQFSVEYLPSSDEKLINNVFDRINRNVAKLTSQELRHAKFDGTFINEAEDLTIWMSNALPSNFPSIAQQSKKQMKDVELVSQLLLLIEEGPKAYSQDDLDKAFSSRDIFWENKDEVVSAFRSVIDFLKKLVKDNSQGVSLSRTRLKNQADFYSLFGAICELIREEIEIDIPKVVLRINHFLETVDNAEERSKDKEAVTTQAEKQGKWAVRKIRALEHPKDCAPAF